MLQLVKIEILDPSEVVLMIDSNAVLLDLENSDIEAVSSEGTQK
jgi:hypothetical protein